ncbi:hypothetical protein EUX98_g8729 [Antrodiella citrinella]|uniref:Uncharacterized protein n=1 Tax=Antrodiella citrinella TaxID=2447956 RepID=A0A4S4M3V9_9APHY|nr:hypothetical protein EUX98_g8729 [Antrodiella citrinella]
MPLLQSLTVDFFASNQAECRASPPIKLSALRSLRIDASAKYCTNLLDCISIPHDTSVSFTVDGDAFTVLSTRLEMSRTPLKSVAITRKDSYTGSIFITLHGWTSIRAFTAKATPANLTLSLDVRHQTGIVKATEQLCTEFLPNDIRTICVDNISLFPKAFWNKLALRMHLKGHAAEGFPETLGSKPLLPSKLPISTSQASFAALFFPRLHTILLMARHYIQLPCHQQIVLPRHFMAFINSGLDGGFGELSVSVAQDMLPPHAGMERVNTLLSQVRECGRPPFPGAQTQEMDIDDPEFTNQYPSPVSYDEDEQYDDEMYDYNDEYDGGNDEDKDGDYEPGRPYDKPTTGRTGQSKDSQQGGRGQQKTRDGRGCNEPTRAKKRADEYEPNSMGHTEAPMHRNPIANNIISALCSSKLVQLDSPLAKQYLKSFDSLLKGYALGHGGEAQTLSDTVLQVQRLDSAREVGRFAYAVGCVRLAAMFNVRQKQGMDRDDVYERDILPGLTAEQAESLTFTLFNDYIEHGTKYATVIAADKWFTGFKINSFTLILRDKKDWEPCYEVLSSQERAPVETLTQTMSFTSDYLDLEDFPTPPAHGASTCQLQDTTKSPIGYPCPSHENFISFSTNFNPKAPTNRNQPFAVNKTVKGKLTRDPWTADQRDYAERAVSVADIKALAETLEHFYPDNGVKTENSYLRIETPVFDERELFIYDVTGDILAFISGSLPRDIRRDILADIKAVMTVFDADCRICPMSSAEPNHKWYGLHFECTYARHGTRGEEFRLDIHPALLFNPEKRSRNDKHATLQLAQMVPYPPLERLKNTDVPTRIFSSLTNN